MQLARKLALSGSRLRLKAIHALSRTGFKEEYFLILLSILIGAATGLFAHGFFFLLEKGSHLAYGSGEDLGWFGGRAWMLILLPASGALLVGLLTRFFAPEAKGHGVPEVMDAIYRRGGEIRPRVAGVKAIASALTIGTGGSAGTEGPIIQIGAAIGSSIGQIVRIPRKHLGIMVACGVAAGIGAIFNAPIAGVLFALEIFLRDFSFRAFSPVVFSSVISCSLMHALRREDTAIFEVAALRAVPGELDPYIFVPTELPFYLVLGVICAIGAVMFIRALYATEDLFDRIRLPEPLKPVVGAIGLGLLGAAFVIYSGPQMPLFFANGYPAVQMSLSPELLGMTITSMLSLFALKLLATCCTLGSGGSGGVFAPSLLLGASLGGAFGLALLKIGFVDELHVPAYALVGMAAMVAGTTHAPLTSIVMLYEITREPKVVLPVMFAAIIATAGSRILFRDSIYTLKLRRRGVRVGSVADLTILRRISVSEVEIHAVTFVHPDDPLQKLIDVAGESDAVDFVVVDDQAVYQGMVPGRDVRTALLQPEAVSLLLVGELMRPGVPTVNERETLDSVLDKFAGAEVEALPVASLKDSTRIEGLITRRAVMRKYHEELEQQMG